MEYKTIFLFFISGLDGRFVSPSIFPLACGTGTWLLCLGFTLAYGAMFSKIWRVHRLATKNKADTLKVRLINNRRR
jgi:gamma-aminobutyric acid type B receptor